MTDSTTADEPAPFDINDHLLTDLESVGSWAGHTVGYRASCACTDPDTSGRGSVEFCDATIAALAVQWLDHIHQVDPDEITPAEIDAVAKVMFEPPTGGSGDYTWDEMIREDPLRADLWRTDALAALEAARKAKAETRG